MVSLKIGETTKCTLGFFLHNNKFVDQQSGSNVQIVVSGPTSTNCVIPNLPRGSRQLYHKDSGLKTGGDDVDDSNVNEYAIEEDGDFIDEDTDLNIIHRW